MKACAKRNSRTSHVMVKWILVYSVGLMMPQSSWFRPWTPLAQQVVHSFTPAVVYSQKRSIDYWGCSRPESLFSQKYGRGPQCEMSKQIHPTSFAQSTSVITTTTQLKNSPSSSDGDPNRSSSFRVLTSTIGGLILVASSITLWSEWTVFQTCCGPLTLSDVVERTCYQVVLVTFSALWFTRIAFQQDLMRSFYTNNIDQLRPDQESQSTVNNRRETGGKEGSSGSSTAEPSPIFLLLRFVEISVYICMMGAIIVLLNQAINQVDLLNAGLSGIDETMCRSKLGFFQESSSSLTTSH